MGVKLDWDIEAEQGKNKQHKEDSEQRSARYLGVFRLLLSVAVFAAILVGIVYVIMQRWEQVNQRQEQVLVDTVQAEVAALRVGDQVSFNALQQSATDDWYIEQQQRFNDYQTLKVESNVILTGQVLSTEIDGRRARVQVEEIIDGVPYVQTWFYWNYNIRQEDETDEDILGWYHVPPDYTFWGEASEITNESHIIRYSLVDEALANDLNTALENWLADTCLYLDCSTIPLITIDIIPAPNNEVRWANDDPTIWQMLLPSPYTGRARADMPFDNTLQIETANAVANRLIDHISNDAQPLPASDAAYLQETIATWMLGRFVQINPETHLIQSFVDNYDVNSISNILTNLQSTSNLSLLASVAGVQSIPELNVDWRDFILWRLELEDRLIESGDEATWTTLYEFSDESIRAIAYQRFVNTFTATNRTILEANLNLSETGIPQLVARVSVTRGFETGEEIIVFNLIDGTWKRVN